MRKVRISLTMVLVLVVLAACASFDQNAYKSLRIAKTSYDTTLSALGDLYKAGKLSEAQKDNIIKVAKVYFVAYQAAVRAYEVYHNTPSVENKDQLIALMTYAADKLGELLPLIQGLGVSVPTLTIVK
jgi:hypothetical protein